MTGYRQDGAGDFGDEPEDRKGITESLHVAGIYELLGHAPIALPEHGDGRVLWRRAKD